VGKSDDPKMEVTQYRMSEHFGICWGPVDYISEIIINEKSAWTGEQSANGEIAINKPELFGGVKKEGGAVGTATFLSGGPTQTIPDWLAEKLGLTEATAPAYRGIASLWFTENEGASPKGFYWTANSPYLPGVWVKTARASLPLGEDYARIYRNEADGNREERTVSNVGLDGAWRLFDIYDSTIVHLSSAESQIIIEDVRAGTVRAAINLTYTPLWFYISPSRDEVLAAGTTGTIYAYDINDGSLKGTTIGPDPNDLLASTPTEIVVSGTTYMFYTSSATVHCFSNGGSGWTYLWSGAYSGIGNYGELVIASPSYLVIRAGNGTVFRAGWSAVSLGSVVTVDFLALLGWAVTSTDPVGSISYVPDLDYWFAISKNGKVATLNSDLTSVVASSSSGQWDGTSDTKPVRSRRILNGSGQAVFFETGPVSGSNAQAIYFYDVATCTQTDRMLLTEWGITTSIQRDAGFSSGQQAIAIFDTFTDDGAHVLMFPLAAGEFDSNPAHIIYECLTNTEWGMGAPVSAIDVDSFEAAAVVLYGERFGLSMIWTQQSTIEAFISEIIDHIEATLFVSPFNGKLTLKLIRDDYAITGLPEFTPDNSVVTNFSRKLWGETVNEIIVTFTNPENEEEETVVAQDLANISSQGGIVSDGRNYYGVRTRELAMKLAQRDLRAAATPLASCDIEVNREAWNLLPGDVVILNSADDGVEQIVMRVGPVDYGKPGDSVVKAQLVEDVFSLALAEYTVPPATEWEDSSEEPSPADATLVMTLPYFLVVQEVSASVSEGAVYPEVFAGVLAAEDGQDTSEFELYGEVVDAAGNVSVDSLGTKTITSRGTLETDIDAEIETLFISFPDRTQGNGPEVGGLMLIEGTGEDDSELCLISAFGGSPTAYTMKRGVLDTTPKDWPAGTPVWFVDETMIYADNEVRSEGETVDYQVLIRTSLGLLSIDDAPIVSYTMTARPWLPLRPANVTFEGVGFGTVDVSDEVGTSPAPTFTVAWSRRNRLTEDSQILAWDAADVTPEAGQTTTITVMDADRNVLEVHSGITGTSYEVPLSAFYDNNSPAGLVDEAIVRVTAERDGLESLQGHEITVILAPLTLSGTPVTTATEGEPYAGFTVSASYGAPPYTYSLVGDWPAGISINSSTGEVSGTPTEAGTFASLSVRVTDGASDMADLDPFTLEVESDVQAPTNTVLPAITGNRWVGQTLSTTNGTWNDNGSAISGYTYQWKRGGVNISGATTSTYQLVGGDAGQNITCTVTATNAGGSTPATSNSLTICADQHWANVVLLCGFNGADGATTTSDDSNSAHALTFVGNAQIDTAESKFGGASLLLDGSGDRLTASDSDDWALGGQWTVECWVRWITLDSNNRGIIGQDGGIANGWTLTGSATIGEISFAVGASVYTTSGAGMTTGVWYHVAADMDGSGKLRIYLDGVMKGSAFPSAVGNSTAALGIGAQRSTGTVDMNGWLDELRITNGAARYASDSGFTVPTAAYPRP